MENLREEDQRIIREDANDVFSLLMFKIMD